MGARSWKQSRPWCPRSLTSPPRSYLNNVLSLSKLTRFMFCFAFLYCVPEQKTFRVLKIKTHSTWGTSGIWITRITQSFLNPLKLSWQLILCCFTQLTVCWQGYCTVYSVHCKPNCSMAGMTNTHIFTSIFSVPISKCSVIHLLLFLIQLYTL